MKFELRSSKFEKANWPSIRSFTLYNSDFALLLCRTVPTQLSLSLTRTMPANLRFACFWLAATSGNFVHKYSIACKEARESHYWQRLLVAGELVPPERLVPLKDEANELVAILTTIVKKSRE